MRLFVAVNLAPEVNARIGALTIPVPAGSVAWVRPENFHVTVKFIGIVQETLIPEILTELKACVGHLPFELAAKGIGSFPPSGRQVEVVWVGIQDASGRLAALAEEVERRLALLGVNRERRAF